MDGFRKIYSHYKRTKRFLRVRKNMHSYKPTWRNCKRSNNNHVGVDLNRNYPFGFNISSASTDPCHWLYRGPFPFSEPETCAVRDFLLKWDNVELVINLHAAGNMLMIPFHSMGKME